MRRSHSSVFAMIFTFVQFSSPLRVFQISPGWSNSHILFNYRLAKTLADHGHNVTLFIPLLVGHEPPPCQTQGVEEIHYRLAASSDSQNQAMADFREMAFAKQNLPIFSTLSSFRQMVTSTCEEILSSHELLDDLSARNFDITLAHPFDTGGVALSDRIGIEKFVWVAPGAFFIDHVYWTMALPYVPSVSPNVFSGSSDRMTFWERVQNTFLWLRSLVAWSVDHLLAESEHAIFHKPPYHTEADPSFHALTQRTRAIFINGEAALDFSRPLVPGVFYLGDLEKRQLKKLPADWQKIVDSSGRGIILFSLGTIANTSAMPMELKEAFFKAFTKFPQYTIIFRLEGRMPEGFNQYDHIKIVKWMPQRELLHHPKTKLFITHAGYNSLLESCQAGVPVIVLPLFADQHANAATAIKHGVGLSLDKLKTTQADVEESMNRILTNQSFYHKARSLSSIISDHIVDNQLMLVRRVERIARANQRWPSMKVPQKLNPMQYACLDVITAFIFLVSITFWSLIKITSKIWRVIQHVQ